MERRKAVRRAAEKNSYLRSSIVEAPEEEKRDQDPVGSSQEGLPDIEEIDQKRP